MEIGKTIRRVDLVCNIMGMVTSMKEVGKKINEQVKELTGFMKEKISI